MKRLFALAICVAAVGFAAVPSSKAEGISISIGSGGYYYPRSYGYGNYYGYGNGYYDPYYSGYSQRAYYSTGPGYYYNSGNPYGYRRSYYHRGRRYIRFVRDNGYRYGRRHHHHDWQD